MEKVLNLNTFPILIIETFTIHNIILYLIIQVIQKKFIIISLSQSIAAHRPPQLLAISLDLRLLGSHPAPPLHLAWRRPTLRLPKLQNSFTHNGSRFYSWYGQKKLLGIRY
jgi:hypothetical protein